MIRFRMDIERVLKDYMELAVKGVLIPKNSCFDRNNEIVD
jgi:hypothetical protein